MPAEKTQDVLRVLERAAVEHLAWLMRVHCALMVPGGSGVPTPPVLDFGDTACGCHEELAGLERAAAAMHAAADRLQSATAEAGRPDPAGYRRFMALVDSYSREFRRAENHFRRALVETDPLTGVHNRQGMMRDLRREWTRALRTGRPCCVAIADLDHFKLVNDRWGHGAGDRVLCHAAHFFQRQLRPYDLVYRYGGEEFLFCLPDTGCETALHVLDRLRALLARHPIQLDCGSRPTVTTSIGVAQMHPEHSVQETMAAADRALYAAKSGGRDRVVTAPAPDGNGVQPLPAPRSPPLRGPMRLDG